MADVILGSPTICTVSESPVNAGKVRITYPVGGIDPIIASRFTTSNYVANVGLTTPATAQILATNATKFIKDPIWFDVNLNFSGTTWTSAHMYAPIWGSTVTCYTTPATCNSGMVTGDTIWVWNSLALAGNRVASVWAWNVTNWGLNKLVDIYGMLPQCQVHLCVSSGTRVYAPNSTGAPNRQYRVENMMFSGIFTIAANVNFPAACSIVFDRIICIGAQLLGKADTATVAQRTVQNCFISAPATLAANGVDNGWFNTIIANAQTGPFVNATANPDGFPRLQNNFIYMAGATDNTGITDYCVFYASWIAENYYGAVASKGFYNRHSYVNWELAAFRLDCPCKPDFVRGAGSLLEGRGTPVPGIDYDLWGNPRATIVPSTAKQITNYDSGGSLQKMYAANHGFATGDVVYMHQGTHTTVTADNFWHRFLLNLYSVVRVDADWFELQDSTAIITAAPTLPVYVQKFSGKRPSIGCSEGVDCSTGETRFW